MTPELWQRIEAAFAQALELVPEQRPPYLDALAVRDPEAAAQVRRLIAADAADDQRLRQPIGRALETFGEELDDPWIDRRLGAYRITRRIATGGMGAVFLAERVDAQFEQQVAIKLVGTQTLAADAQARFRAERQILAGMQHPFIAHLLDGGTTEDGAAYLVMEYVVGEPIDAYCTADHLPVDATLRLFKKVCAAVAYAHRNLVVHRDLKPGNILVDAQGDPKLLDFGIAKLISDTPDTADQTVQRLTPDYASPEQILGEPVTTVSDVYALGVLLYKLLSGQRPYELAGLRPAEVERLVVETGPIRPSVASRGSDAGEALPAELDALVLKAMNPEPEQRYASVLALSEDIDRYLSGQPLQARAGGWWYPARKFLHRHTAAVGLAVTLFIGALVAAGYHNKTLTAERDEARFEASRAQAVTDFLIDLFRQANPNESQGEDISAREILDTGATQLDEHLSDQPRIRAELRRSIGTVYAYLGLYQAAATQFRDAVALHEDLDDPAGLGRSLSGLGEALLDLGQLDEAALIHERALNLRRQTFGDVSIPVAYSLSELGYVRFSAGDYVASDALGREALTILEQSGATDDDYYSNLLHSLAQSLQIQDRLTEAEQFFRRSLEWDLDHHGERHTNSLTSLHDLASVLVQLERFVEAEPLFLKVAAIETDMLGPDYPQHNLTLNSLGQLYQKMERLDDAERYLRDAVEHARRVRGAEHPHTAYLIVGLVNLLNERARFDEAQSLVDEALAIYAATVPDDYPHLATARIAQARTLIGLSRLPAAETAARQALAVCAAALPAGHWLAERAQALVDETVAAQSAGTH